MSYNDKQLQIMGIAERLFANRGFDGTSVRDIAEEAGVNIAMISYYFGSKERLMQAIFEERATYIRLRVESLLKDTQLSPFEKVNLLIDDYIDRLLERQRFYRIMVCEQMLEKNETLISLMAEVKKKNAEMIQKLLQEGQQKGVFKKEVDVLFLLQTMTGVIAQVFINRKYYRSFNHLEAMPDAEFDQYLKDKLSKHIKFLFKALLSYEA